MLNTNLVLNLVLFALFELNFDCRSIAAEIVESSKATNSSKLNSIQTSRQLNEQSKTILNFDWDLDTAAGHKKEVFLLLKKNILFF